MMGGEKEGDGDGLGRFHGIFSEVCLFYFSISNGTYAKYALEAFLRIRFFFFFFYSTPLKHLHYCLLQGNYSENIY